jgi:nitrate reductase beta subunit
MKPAIFILSIFMICSCGNSENKKLQSRIDSLEKKLDNTYKPGFGEFMSSIQIHHNKLWFAGTNENWPLADFEIHEIMESIDAIVKYEPERDESKSTPMLKPALDSVNAAIQNKNLEQFKNSFVLLTNTCNNCHKAVNFSFNEVKIPDNPPFSNQVFKKHE